MNIGFPGSSVPKFKPVALVCHICGREYGTSSLAIHIPQCTKLWEERESLKPKNERRPVPQPIADLPVNSGGKAASMAAYNEAAAQQYREAGMVQCEHCGRRFADDRIAIHHRSCTADKPARRVEETAPRTALGVDKPHRLDALALQAQQNQPEKSPHKPVANRPTTMVNGRKSVGNGKPQVQAPAAANEIYAYNNSSDGENFQNHGSALSPSNYRRPATQATVNGNQQKPNKLNALSPAAAAGASPNSTHFGFKPPASPSSNQQGGRPTSSSQDISSLEHKMDAMQQQLHTLMQHLMSNKSSLNNVSDAECTGCHTSLVENARFCYSCGVSIFGD